METKNPIKNYKPQILIFIGVLVVFYLGASFAEWEINPKHWEQEVRVFIAIFGIFCAAIFSFLTHLEL